MEINETNMQPEPSAGIPETPVLQEKSRLTPLRITILVVVVALIGITAWYLLRGDQVVVDQNTEVTQDSAQQEGLGAELYSEGQASAAVPETNPFQDTYKNPFE